MLLFLSRSCFLFCVPGGTSDAMKSTAPFLPCVSHSTEVLLRYTLLGVFLTSFSNDLECLSSKIGSEHYFRLPITIFQFRLFSLIQQRKLCQYSRISLHASKNYG